MRPIPAIGLLAVCALAGACTDDGDDDATPTTVAGDRVEIEVSIPDTDDLTDAVLPGLDGGRVAFADYEGRPVVVNFFASTCAPCIEEMPDLESVHQDLGEQVAFVGVATNDRVDAALERAEETGVTWDLANDARGELITSVGGVILPTTVLLGPDGEVLEVHGGQISGDELRDLLEDRTGVTS